MATEKERAAQARRAFDATREAIFNDATLDAQGRDRALRAARQTLDDTLGALRGEFFGGISDRREAVLRRLSSPPAASGGASAQIAATASFRDAMQRATATKANTGELPSLLALAERVDDQMLAKAAFVVALDRGDARTVETYAASHPEVVADLEALDELSTPGSARSRMIDRMSFSAGGR